MTLIQSVQQDASHLLDAANRNDWQQVHDIAKAIVSSSLDLLTEEMYRDNDNSEMFEK